MNVSPEIIQAFQRAAQLHARGRLSEAEQAYLELARAGEQREAALVALSDLYLQTGRAQQAVDTLISLTEEVPERLAYVVRLASLLESFGQSDAAIRHYVGFLDRQPDSADAHFNLALTYKNAKRLSDAEEAYNKAIQLGISNVEEVYSNLGVLYSGMRDAEKALKMYEAAIDIDPQYIPALFNLAGLYEEQGDRERAIELYRHVLSIEPRHWESLSRIANASRVAGDDDGLVREITQAIDATGDDQEGQESLYFALGKVLDELGRYDDAFDAYRNANELAKARNAPWNRAATERGIGSLISVFDRSWLERVSTSNAASPIFVCGMFRSGSTLTEQILAKHPSVQTAGEFGYLTQLVKRWLSPYPDRLRDIAAEQLNMVADEYMSKLQALFPGAANVTDKQPDNFLHLGLIRAMFPSARIVYTKRSRPDNCLSIYFAHLGNNLGYSRDLGDIAHYYDQHERLMAHWIDILGDRIFVVDYDELVVDPESVLRAMLEFLGLPWDERCLDFQDADVLVKTASIWQVREPLHAKSSGRWKNYEKYLADVIESS